MASLNLTFDSIANANILVGDASVVGDWNTFFDLPTYGTPFSAVTLSGNTVQLFGGNGITLKDNLFSPGNIGNTNIIQVIDSVGCITTGGNYCFLQCSNLTTIDLPNLTTAAGTFNQCNGLMSINLPSLTTAGGQCFYSCQSLITIDLPNLTTVGNQCFELCISLTTISLPSCLLLGQSVKSDNVFDVINANTITLTIPSVLMTCNDGGPDGDIQVLQANNIVTVVETANNYNINNNINAFNLSFIPISAADLLVGDATNVSDWNTFFDLPTNGTPFSAVTISGNTVQLFGGSDIMLDNGGDYTNNLFSGNINLIEIADPIGCITGFGEGVFYNCTNLQSAEFTASVIDFTNAWYILGSDYTQSLSYVSFPNITSAITVSVDPLYGVFSYIGYSQDSVDTTFNLPNLTTAGNGCFAYCASFTTINLSSLITTGESFLDGCTSLSTINLPNLIIAGIDCFYGCTSITSINLPSLTATGEYCFSYCTSLTTINIPSCTDLGGTVGNNNVFLDIIGNTITLTVPPVLMTCDSGSPDGDIQYLQANNTVTIIEVTPTPTPSPTGSIVTTPTPTPTKTSSPTPSVTPTNTPSPTFIPYSGVAVNQHYAYTIEMLGDFSGGTAPANAIAPHPIMIGNDGIPYAQMNAIQIGGFGGLNN